MDFTGFRINNFFQCVQKKDRPSIPNVIPAKGIFVLNEGGFGSNNASLGYYDFSSNIYTGGLFQQQNGFKLGDVANDALIYGGKLYIVVNNSGLLMITNAATGKMIDSVSFKNANKQSTSPRHIVAYNGKVYVSTWLDGVKVIDTASLKITQSIALRNYGEGIAVANGKLCVGLSGPWGAMDSVVSVFALPAGSLEKNMVVGKT
ncbi:MAG: hypothetical protein IPH58_02775 [Sphingobacteriales bacterium]|nr:hypothetical protein [Sphingobacteriales bacterium]